MKYTRGVKSVILFPSARDFPVLISKVRLQDHDLHPLEVHPEVEIQFIQMGAGAYVIGQRIYSFRRRTVLVIKPNQPHRLLPDSHIVMEKMFVAFRSNLLKDSCLGRIINELPAMLHLMEEENARIEISWRSIQAEFETKDRYWQDMITQELMRLLILLLRVSQRKEPNAVPDERVVKVLDYVDKNFCQAITVTGLAQAVAVSPSHLAHRFKRQTGMGIRRYLLQRRIAEAKTILETSPDIKLTALAAQLGFSNFALFNRAFQHLTGMTPSNWRRISHIQGRK